VAIVPMKRLSVIGPVAERHALLERLQALGAIHLVAQRHDSSDEAPAELATRLATLRRCKAALVQVAAATAKGQQAPTPGDPDVASLTAPQVIQACDAALNRKAELELRLNALAKEATAAEAWGEICAADLALLQEHGLKLRVYALRSAALKNVTLPEGVAGQRVDLGALAKGRSGYLIASFGELPELDGEPIEVPARPAAVITADLNRRQEEAAEVTAKIAALSTRLPALAEEEARLQDEIAMSDAKRRSGDHQALFSVTGWCPSEQTETIKEAVVAARGALLIEEPAPDDVPPIALKNGPLVRFFEPLLKAFQLPHYREADPTWLIAPFMAIFFGFCLGDAGYGLVLFGAATWGRQKLGMTSGEGNKVFRLLQTLGVSTMLVGLLLGNFFGIALYELAVVQQNTFLVPLSVLSVEPDKFFYTALAFGVFQLSVGMVVRLVRRLLLGEMQSALGTLGWLALLPGIGVWVALDNVWLFLAAVAVVFLFNSPSPRLGKRLGGGAWALYNITSLFGDVMSYARIFGLGLSSGIIAQVVNIIAMTVYAGVPSVGGVIGAALILLFGHSFNFVMATIGAVVHPARLQFLEFFGKFFEGGGEAYRPFQRSGKGG